MNEQNDSWGVGQFEHSARDEVFNKPLLFSLQITISFWKIASDSAASGYRTSLTIPLRVPFAKLSRSLSGISKMREEEKEGGGGEEEGERVRLSRNSEMKWPAIGCTRE